MSATVKLTTRDSFHDFSAALNMRKAFKTSGSLKGGPVTDAATYTGWDMGSLDFEHYDSVRRADYIVWSYRTPIAWADAETGEWTVPDDRYSVTTSRHQSKIRTAVSVLS